MILQISKSLYSLKSVKDCIYWHSRDFVIELKDSHEFYLVECEKWNDENKNDFIKSLNDFSLRDMIASETQVIKQLVATKAFYPDFIKFQPTGKFDDPVKMDKNEAE